MAGGTPWTALAARDIPVSLSSHDISQSSSGRTSQQLLVGTADNEIRVFQQDDIVGEAMESDAIVSICAMRPGSAMFGYGLRNGAVGVYDGIKRLWTTRAKFPVSALCAFDLDGDGVPELVSGYANGLVQNSTRFDGRSCCSQTRCPPASPGSL